MALVRRVPLLLALPLILTVGACATMGSPTIEQVQANPSRYNDRTVTVTGTVTSAWGIPLVPYKMYRVSDGTAEILVLSDGNRTPTAARGSASAVRWTISPSSAAGPWGSTSARRASRCCS